MPVNVLYASHTPSLTGSAVSMFQLATRLDGAKYRPLVAFSKDGPVAEKFRARQVPVHILARRGLLGSGLIREAMGLIRDQGVGLVHLNSASPFVKYVGIAAKLCGVPVIWHIREDARGKRVAGLGKWAGLLADRIVVISTELEELFSGTGKAVKIYNGVDTEEFSPTVDGSAFRALSGLGAGGFVFGFVGTIEPRKGVMVFAEAADALVRDGVDARFAVVGSGMPEHEDWLRRFIASRPSLAGRIYLAGRISGVAGAMAAMDAVVMPSLVEPFGRVVIEAMAAGRPVIASNVGEVPYILDGGRLGYMFPPGDAVALAAAMKDCMRAGPEYAAVIQAARERAASVFNIEGHVRRVAELYGELLGEKGRPTIKP